MNRTKHLSSCPVYGNNPIDDKPCKCSEVVDETTLLFKRVGNYSTNQAKPTDHCFLCKNEKFGTILVGLPTSGGNVCVDCLLHEYDSTRGLIVIDKPEILTKEQKKYCFELTDKLTHKISEQDANEN